MNEVVYLHRVALAFYPTAIYGTRLLLVPDPRWTMSEDAPDAEQPLIEVQNPDCQLPAAADLIELSDDEYEYLKSAASIGKVIGLVKGRPVLLDPPPPTPDVQRINELAWRDAQMLATESLIAQHRDEVDADVDTTLTAEQYKLLQKYRVALRAWPEAKEFPDSAKRPVAGDWLISVL